jgi:Nuclease-related domain
VKSWVHASDSGTGQTAPVNGRTLQGSDGEPEWRDLAANRPGQAARKVALERRQAAPVKTVLARVLQVHTNERAWRVGAEGEEEVARHLGKLREGWRVLHAVPVGEEGSDIDHVVIGPTGVFTLNTKNHVRGNVWVTDTVFMVNGQKKEYFRNSRHEAKRASRLLSAACGFEVPVEPVIVVMAARLTVKSHPADVHVVGRKRIRKWLTHQRPLLTPERVEQIYGYARRDLTWRPTLG